MAGRALGLVTGERVALVLIANVAALAAAMLLYRLVRWERGDAALATRAVWFLSLAPPAFVFVMAYSDAPAILLAIATFLAMRRRRWWWAAAAAACVGVSRPTGVILALPVLVEAWRGFSATALRERVGRVAAVAAAPLGALVYLGWVGATRGDLMLPYSVQATARLHGEFANPFSTLWNAVEGVFDHRVGTALHVPWLVVMVALVVIVFVRWPASYGVFAAAVVGSSVTSTNLDSLERYGLFAFPLVLAVADLTEHRLVERLAFVLLPVALFAYAVLAFSGLYVP
jgi:Gpi18-like mannosyltransferase